MDTDTLYKNRIQQRLAAILLDAFENETLPQANISYLAGYIREELGRANTSAELFTFLEELAREWPIFESLVKEPSVPSWQLQKEAGEKVTLQNLVQKPGAGDVKN